MDKIVRSDSVSLCVAAPTENPAPPKPSDWRTNSFSITSPTRGHDQMAQSLLNLNISTDQPKMSTREEFSALAREILNYLNRRTAAGDTLVGIARWWLPRQRIEVVTEEVKAALDELILRRLVIPDQGTDGHLCYWSKNNPHRKSRRGQGH